MQNHLMELFALVAMEIPTNSGNITEILHSKVQVLQQVEPVSESSVLTGQYATYNREFKEEAKRSDVNSRTPTFGAALLRVNNARWKGVPFVLMSGKKLDEKASYVRLVFKSNSMCMSPSADCSQLQQIVFYIGGSDSRLPPMILVSQSLPKVKVHQGWRVEQLPLNLSFFGQNISATYHVIPEEDDDAYANLIQAVFLGERHLFVDKDSLLASWRIWSDLIQMSSSSLPRIYHGKDIEPELLDFHLEAGRGLKFNLDQDVVRADHVTVKHQDRLAQIPGLFRGHELISGRTKDLVMKLAEDILGRALVSTSERGTFHLALSGGRSPLQLLRTLTSPGFSTFPWRQTHIWLVDERCVPLNDANSNFKLLQDNLLDHISIPFFNVHPMPVHLTPDLCDLNDHGDLLYQSAISMTVPDQRMDFTILGLGTDGHTASLFPNQTSLQSDQLVTYAQSSSGSKRMTFTFDLINRSREVGVLVTGTGKHNIVLTLSSNVTDVNQFPVTGVKPSEGKLVWYMDYEALLGEDDLS